jgi:hypothetical protein
VRTLLLLLAEAGASAKNCVPKQELGNEKKEPGKSGRSPPSPAHLWGWGREFEEGGRGLNPWPLPSNHFLPYSDLDRTAWPFCSLIMAWAAAMRAMGMRMGEHDT